MAMMEMTYWFEDGYLTAFIIVIGFDRSIIVFVVQFEV